MADIGRRGVALWEVLMIECQAQRMNQPKKTRGAWSAVGVGSEMVAATFVGAAIGWGLDQLTGWSPWLTVVFFLLGSAAGFMLVYRGLQNGGGKSD